MKTSSKVLIGLAIALGLAFFVFKKSAAAEDAVPVSTGAGGGVLGKIVGGAKKIFGAVKKILGGGAAVVPDSVAGGAGVLAGGGAGFSAAAAGGNIVTAGGSLIAAPTAAAEAAVVPGSVAGGGALAVLGPPLMLVSPFILGPPLAHLVGGKTHEEWVAQLAREDAAEEALKAEIAARVGNSEVLPVPADTFYVM